MVNFHSRPAARSFFAFAMLAGIVLSSRTALAQATTPAATQPAEKSTEFIRFVEGEKGAAVLEAAIVSYKDAKGRQVDLVSALHVGEKAYYDTLSGQFKQYDALLYEMVKPKDAVIRQGQKGGGMVSGFQRFLKTALELEFQLDAIDYTAANFVHADLDAETFSKLQSERGESLFTLMLQSMITQMQRQAAGTLRPITLIDILVAMKSPDSARQYKLLLARQFEDLEAQMAGIGGEEGTVILDERNKAAVKVLQTRLEEGDKKLGIFYGAAHMTGIEKILVNDMGFKKTGEKWLVAWDMTPAPTTAPASQPATAPATLPVSK